MSGLYGNPNPKLCDIHRDTIKIIIYKIKQWEGLGNDPYSYKYEAVSVVPARRRKWIAKLFRLPEYYTVKQKIQQWAIGGDMMDPCYVPKYYCTDNLFEIQKDCIDIWNYCCPGPKNIEVVEK